MRIVVYHGGYGCDTGCCGHYFEVDGAVHGQFMFDHPYGEDFLEWAKELVREEFGAEHIADLVWDECLISDD
jgi:hypothetical protein